MTRVLFAGGFGPLMSKYESDGKRNIPGRKNGGGKSAVPIGGENAKFGPSDALGSQKLVLVPTPKSSACTPRLLFENELTPGMLKMPWLRSTLWPSRWMRPLLSSPTRPDWSRFVADT